MARGTIDIAAPAQGPVRALLDIVVEWIALRRAQLDFHKYVIVVRGVQHRQVGEIRPRLAFQKHAVHVHGRVFMARGFGIPKPLAGGAMTKSSWTSCRGESPHDFASLVQFGDMAGVQGQGVFLRLVGRPDWVTPLNSIFIAARSRSLQGALIGPRDTGVARARRRALLD